MKPTTIPLKGEYDNGPDKLVMRVPTRLDIKKANRAAPKDESEAQDIALASLCGVEIDFIESLILPDYAALQSALEAYLGNA